jgi:hypothetical protein
VSIEDITDQMGYSRIAELQAFMIEEDLARRCRGNPRNHVVRCATEKS